MTGREKTFRSDGGFRSIPVTAPGPILLVARIAPGAGTVVAQSIVLVTIVNGLGAFLMLWSEKPANG
ncbi:hypothetical protein [Microbacterium sp. K2]|uniref:hypothetical protein n=1 Tax=Microbacterium sp. K2 TaxID=3391827 RepID=UPI003ED85CE6